MFRSAVRSVIASRGRFVLTGTSITLSVAFLVATLVLSDSMRGRAADDIATALAGTDAVVQGISLVSTLRTAVSQEVQRYGMDGLNERLQAKIHDPALAPPAVGTY